MAKPLLKIENVVKKFGTTLAVDDVSLDIVDGEFLALLGPSGCGKTTLLRILGGFETADTGRVLIDGQDITHLPPNKRPLNMLFQSYAVFPHMTVRQNVGYGLRFTNISKDEANRRIDEVLELIHMSSYGDRKPNQLSGGQSQRVALARCIVLRPKILLLDEPLSALDAKLREIMQIELVNLQKIMGITFIVVTHDQDEALSMATRIAVMEKGKIRGVADPKTMYESPNCRFVADFIGRMNRLQAWVTPTNDSITLKLSDTEAIHLPKNEHNIDTECQTDIGIRPINFVWTAEPISNPNKISFFVTIKNNSYYGEETLLQCQTESGNMLSTIYINRHRNAPLPAVGQSGYLSCDVDDIIIFSPSEN